MAAVTPVSPNNSLPLQPVDPAGPAKNSLTAEQRLMDYIARFQAEGLARGQHLANPAALGGEALKALNGYFERATALQENAARKARAMSDDNSEIKAQDGATQIAQLPAGPASDRLEPIAEIGEAPVERKVSGITDAELDRTVEALMAVMGYGVETSMITTATNNISKSSSTLIRGQ
jgi:hypothetical protein